MPFVETTSRSEPPPPGPHQDGGTGDHAYAAGRVGVGVGLLIVVPAFVTLMTVREPNAFKEVLTGAGGGAATPYGYTWSLSLYVIPAARLLYWFFYESVAIRRADTKHYRRRAFVWTLCLLVPIGFLLDLVFGDLFFDFPNEAATLQFYLPGFSFEDFRLHRTLPIEEFLFYLFGFVTILLVYIWANDDWVPAYGLPEGGDVPVAAKRVPRQRSSVWWGLLMLGGAVAYKKWLADVEDREGFPLYLTFLVVAAVLPGMSLFHQVRTVVNWRAFGTTILWVLLTSLLWEATLASPYGWWRYNDRWMMGLNVNAWADLPVEAVLLWLVVTFTTVLVYEAVKIELRRRDHVSPDR